MPNSGYFTCAKQCAARAHSAHTGSSAESLFTCAKQGERRWLTLNLATLQRTSSSYNFNDSPFKLQTISLAFRTTETALSRNPRCRAPPRPPPFLRYTLPAPRAKSATTSNWVVRIGEGL